MAPLSLDFEKVTLLEVASAAGAVTLNLRPAQGFRYKIIMAYGYHNDNAGAHTLSFQLFDGATTIPLTGTSRAQDILHFLHSSDGAVAVPSIWMSPIVIDYDRYVQLKADAMGAAKVLVIRAVVQKICTGEGLP